MKKIFVLTDFVFGDSTKGTTTAWLCHRFRARHVIRNGGCQAFHHVVMADGREHTFSQFGSGTLLGAATYLSQHMVIDPYALLHEGRALQGELGVTNAFDLMTINEEALVISPFQAIANRLRELARGEGRHGTVGIGVGETVLDSEQFQDTTIRVKDLGKPWLRDKLAAIRERKLAELAEIIDLLGPDCERAARDIQNLRNPNIVGWAADEFDYMASVVKIVDDSYGAELLRQPGVIVCEPSQGVLLDRWAGFHPHTTKVETTSRDVLALIKSHNYDGEVVRLGLTRAYHHRHGAGPFVTENAEVTKCIPDSFNTDHEWQGHFRVGHFDALAVRYAIEACGGPKTFDGLVVSCLDRISGIPNLGICDGYTCPAPNQEIDRYFARKGSLITDIGPTPGTRDDTQLNHQAGLSNLLSQCKPVLTSIEGPTKYLEALSVRLPVPIAVASYGPTEQNKVVLRGL
ncbi:MAG TPA: adenylosuccinate synthetase [Verrucomicrobiae bacterium]|nr:adenylosuccinate synthetase [Verrucomicrobiae bacterium]